MAKEDGMNAELIDLYRSVQHRRGEWQVGDRVYLTRMNEYGTVHTLRSDGDIDVRFDGGWTLDCCHDDPDLLWLPPVWSEDERCLWKMVDWGKWSMWIGEGGLVSIHKWTAIIEDGYLCWDKPLPEAILRAIAAGKG